MSDDVQQGPSASSLVARPRVEGEEAIAWLKSLTLIPEDTGVRPDAMGCVTPSEYRARAEQLVDNLAAHNAALTAEVERLREAGEWFLYCVEGEQILAIPDEDQRATFAAALALPTNAQEGTDG